MKIPINNLAARELIRHMPPPSNQSVVYATQMSDINDTLVARVDFNCYVAILSHKMLFSTDFGLYICSERERMDANTSQQVLFVNRKDISGGKSSDGLHFNIVKKKPLFCSFRPSPIPMHSELGGLYE